MSWKALDTFSDCAPTASAKATKVAVMTSFFIFILFYCLLFFGFLIHIFFTFHLFCIVSFGIIALGSKIFRTFRYF